MTLKIDFQNQILALFDDYFWPFNKSHEKIKSVFVISAIWNVFIKFHWHDEKLTAGCLALKSTTVIMLLKRCTEVCHKAMKMSRNIFVRSAQKSFFQKREWNSIKETNVWARKKSIVTYVSRKKNSGLQLYSLGTSCEVYKRNDLSVASTETKYIKLKTKTRNNIIIFGFSSKKWYCYFGFY